MSKKISDFTSVNEWWDTKGASVYGSISDIDAIITIKQRQASSLQKARAHYNLARLVKNTFNRVVKIPGLRREVGMAEQERENLRQGLYEKADQHADAMLVEVCKHSSDIKTQRDDFVALLTPLKERQEILDTIGSRTDELVELIDDALEEVKQASWCETMDMVGSNPINTLLSRKETSEAIEHINKVHEGLDEYKKFMSDCKMNMPDGDFEDLGTDSMSHTSDWDLWLGVIDADVFSFFTSLKSKQQLEEAKDSLEDLRERVAEVGEQVNRQAWDNKTGLDGVSQEYEDFRLKAIRENISSSFFLDCLMQKAAGKGFEPDNNKGIKGRLQKISFERNPQDGASNSPVVIDRKGARQGLGALGKN